MKPLRLTLRLHNNQLRERREALGMSAEKLAEAVGIKTHTYLRLESLRGGPTNRCGGWTTTATKLAEFYRVTEDILFPPIVHKVKKPRAELKLNEADAQALLPDYMRQAALGPEETLQAKEMRKAMENGMQRALCVLTPNERNVIEHRYGLGRCEPKTTVDAARKLGKSASAVHGTEANALRKFRRLFRGIELSDLIPNNR